MMIVVFTNSNTGHTLAVIFACPATRFGKGHFLSQQFSINPLGRKLEIQNKNTV
jgi:hypothetical protein